MPHDLAAKGADRIRAGNLKAEQQLAMELLMGLGEEALPVLEDLAASPDPLRRAAALEVLSSRPGEAARFLPFLSDPSYTVRKSALEGIQNAPDGGRVWERLVPLLDDPFWPVRSSALKAMAAWPEPGTAAHFFRALRDPEPVVRETALRYLDELEEEIAPEALREASEHLQGKDLEAFLRACVPLVREKNLPFFQALAEEEMGTPLGTFALLVRAALEPTVPAEWVPLLIDHSLDSDRNLSEAACVLLRLGGEKIVPEIRARLGREGSEDAAGPRLLVHLLLSVLGNDALSHLVDWVEDETLLMEVRFACLDGLLGEDRPEGLTAVVALFPGLDRDLKQHAVQRCISFVYDSLGEEVLPLLLEALALPDRATVQKAFGALCQLEPPPVDELVRVFRAEEDPATRAAFARSLGNGARGENREPIARLFMEEITERLPAAVEAALQLPGLADRALAEAAVELMKGLLEEHALEPGTWMLLLVALTRLDAPEADRVAADALEQGLKASEDLNRAFLVAHLDKRKGPRTSAFLHALYPDADQELKQRILRTLVRRDDPAALEWIEEIFADSTVSYRRSILEDLAASGLSEASGPFLRGILVHEKNPDLLASAIEAAPRSLLEGLEDRLIELAEVGPELGMDTVAAVLSALQRVGSEQGRDYLLEKVRTFVDDATLHPLPGRLESFSADLALMAANKLAEARDPEAPPLLARLLFLRDLAFRKYDILALWNAESEGGTFKRNHSFARTVLSGLLAFEDEVAEKAVLEEIEAWTRNGRIYQCGDAVFSSLCRTLVLERRRCPRLAAKLAALTLGCAQAYSPSDFRILLLRADEASAGGDHESAARALEGAYHILKFYPSLGRTVVRDELGDADPFKGYFPAQVLVSDMHLQRALALRASGQNDRAEEELRRARRRSPFREPE